jgi:DME family drug/metabolite transporter
MFSIGAVLLAPILAIEPLGWLVRPRGTAMALHLGAVTIGVAYTLYGWGLRRLAVPTVVTLTLAEPLTAAILGTAVLGERLGPLGWLGAALIGAGLLVAARAELPAAQRSTQDTGEAAERDESWFDPQGIRSSSAATAPPTSEAPR